MTHYLCLGAGMQGTAAAYDLLTHGEALKLTLVDGDEPRLQAAGERLRALVPGDRLALVQLDAADPAALKPLFADADVCMNCLPYRFSEAMTQLALDAGTHYLDLGGNTDIVRRQLETAQQHLRGAELCVLPDCGLMPGMGNVFAAYAVAHFGECKQVTVRCGGLPQDPKPPLDYMLLFNVGGLTNEYFGEAYVLRDGKLLNVPTFTELEDVSVEGLPPCEAFITSGGLSTTPWTFAGKVGSLDYKTVRYRGHHAKFKLLLDLGLLEEQSVDVGGVRVSPRALLHHQLEQHLAFPGDRDLAFLRCTATDAAGERTLVLEILDRFDETTGFTAMERTTAFSATACAHAAATGRALPGQPLEASVDPRWFVEALRERGIAVRVDER